MPIEINMVYRFPWYRCGDPRHPGCNRLITVLEEVADAPKGIGCRGCGFNRYRAEVRGPRWYEFLLPRVWVMYLTLYRGGFVINVAPDWADGPAKPERVP